MDRLAFKQIVQAAPVDPEKARGSLLIALRRFEDSKGPIMRSAFVCQKDSAPSLLLSTT